MRSARLTETPQTPALDSSAGDMARATRRVRSIGLALLLLAIAGCTSIPSARQQIPDVGAVEIAESGQGATIVLQAGLGDGIDAWQRVWEGLSGVGHAVAYTRPGMGKSAPTNAPRDPCTIARELRTLLRERGLAPPYVLVGHSIGGLYQWVYAALYPDEVAALVLIDPTHPEHWLRLQRDAPATATMIRGMRALFSDAMRAEFDAQRTCLDTLDSSAARRVPARLLVRTQYELVELGAFRSTVEALQDDWLRLVAAPRVERVPGSGHYVQRDRPEAVVRAVREALPQAAPSRPGR